MLDVDATKEFIGKNKRKKFFTSSAIDKYGKVKNMDKESTFPNAVNVNS